MRTFLTMIAILTLSLPALSFTLNSPDNSNLRGWQDAKVKFLVNPSGCGSTDVVALIKEAAEVWNGVPTSKVEVSYGGETASTGLASPPTVYCDSNFEGTTHLDGDYVPGAGFVSAPNGQITSGALYLNTSAKRGNIANFDHDQLVLIVAHEIGHVLGLGHSQEERALMYFSAGSKVEHNLSQDDIDGITYLYPSDEFSGSGIAGCGLVKSLPPPPPGSTQIALFILLLAPFFVASALKKQRSV